MKLFSESWHHRLATFYGPLTTWVDDREVDFCQYFWASTKGAFSVAGLIFIGGVVSLLLGDFAAWVTAMVVNGMWLSPDDPAFIMAALMVFGILGVALFLFIDNVVIPTQRKVVNSIKRMSETPVEDTTSFSFVKTWLYTFKHKVCVPVKVKGISSK
jgi:hypothetical protein